MKYISYGLALAGITLLILLVCLTVMGRDIRSNETEQGLSEAVHSTLQGRYDEEKFYTVDNQQEFSGGFLQRLAMQVESDSHVAMSVVDADDENGILSVKITEKYRHPNDAEGTLECSKTILKDSEAEQDTEIVKLYFYGSREEMESGDEPISEGTCVSGSVPGMPKAPEAEEGRVFQGFFDAEGNQFMDGVALYGKEGETLTEYKFYAAYQ